MGRKHTPQYSPWRESAKGMNPMGPAQEGGSSPSDDCRARPWHPGEGSVAQAGLLATGTALSLMPRPRTDRQAIEEELNELTVHLAERQRELAATPRENREQREALEWRIRRGERRITDLRARLQRASG
jgi:hypothetical protein